MKILKQSTATTLLLGPFVNETDGKTAETGLTISQADVLLWKEGGTTLAQKNEATSCTHRSNGLYTCPLNTTDTNTLGILTVSVHESGALPVRHDFYVVPANVFDAMVLGTDVLQVDVSQFGNSNGTFSGGRPEVNTTHAAGTAWGSGAITAASIASDAITAAKIADNAIDAGAIASDAITAAKIADNAIDAGAIATGAITAAKFAASAITSTVLAPDAITATILADDAITASKIAANAITSSELADGAITSAKFAAGAITASVIATDAIDADALATDAVTEISNSGNPFVLESGTAQGGTVSTITLKADASATDDIYNWDVILTKTGTGALQSRIITDYNGTTKVATVEPVFVTAPDATTTYIIGGFGAELTTVDNLVDAIYDQPVADNQIVGSRGEAMPANVIMISDDPGAADALESFSDGTIPFPVNVEQINAVEIIGDGDGSPFDVA